MLSPDSAPVATLRVLQTIDALIEWRASRRGQVGLIPTMGNLHAGHVALMEAARAQCDQVIASVFVNPLQFGPGEDLDSYPRTFDADCRVLAEAGVDAVFAPDVAQMYPYGGLSVTIVRVTGVTDMLCGTRRPGHFDGVATVVAKLFNLVRPDAAFFGEKDYQQLAVIRRVAMDLCTGVTVRGVPTVREADGLARSSRNQYLDTNQRRRAVALPQALRDCIDRLATGDRDFPALEARGRAWLGDAGVEPDYFEIRDAELAIPVATTRHFRVLAAGFIGRARLIDNMGFSLAGGDV